MPRKQLVGVVHSMPVWLPRTSPWLHALITHMPAFIESHVACESVSHLRQFPVNNLHVLRSVSRPRYVAYRLSRRFIWRQFLQYSSEVAKSVGATILHSHWGDVGWKDRIGARRKGLRHVVTFYGKDVNYLPNRFPKWRERYLRLFETVDAVLCEGPHMGRCIAALGCPLERINVLHLGTDSQSIAFQPRKWSSTATLRILIAASFREKKGITYGLSAIGELLSRGYDVEVTVVGDASEDPRSQIEKQAILATVARYRMENRVRFIGYVDYRALLAESYRNHVYLAPSVTASDGDTEGGAPVSLIDMAATGIPIVSTTHCDIPEVVVNGVTGLLAPERDVDSLVKHLIWLIEHPESWESMLHAARRRIEDEFDVVSQAVRLAEAYQRIAFRES